MIAQALCFAALTFCFFEALVIISSSALGSFLMVRGVACYAGHYYPEPVVLEMMKDGIVTEIDPLYWCYVGGFLLVFVLSSLF